jgi:hypothetical protein
MTLSGRYETRATKENDSGSDRALATSLAKGPVLPLSESWMRFSLLQPAVAAKRHIALRQAPKKARERRREGIAARQRRYVGVSVPQSVQTGW